MHFVKEDVPFENEEMNRAYPNGFNEGYIDIKNVLSKNEKMKYEITGDKNDILEVKLDKLLKAGEQVKIDLKYNVKLKTLENAIPEFLKYNIVESEIENVC